VSEVHVHAVTSGKLAYYTVARQNPDWVRVAEGIKVSVGAMAVIRYVGVGS
jgi:hypothetical protein